MYYDGKKPDVMNWHLIEGATLVGQFDLPRLEPVDHVDPRNLVPFHHLGTDKRKDESWFHFYIDDYRMERFWRNPEKYLPSLLKCAGGIGPDFSVLLDQPRAQQIANAYRNYALTYWLQKQAAKEGKQIIPNACFSDAESLKWIIEPLPEKSVIAVTTQGCMKNRVCKQALVNGLHTLVREKKPRMLVVYGLFPDEWKERFSVPIVVFNSFSAERWGS